MMPHKKKNTYKKLPATSQAKPSQAAKQRFRSVGGGDLGEGAASLPKETKPCRSLLVFFVVMIVELQGFDKVMPKSLLSLSPLVNATSRSHA